MLVILSPIIPFNCQDIYLQISHIRNKQQKLIGMERLVDERLLSEKFSYNASKDFDFNTENLMQIRKEVVASMDPYIEK